MYEQISVAKAEQSAEMFNAELTLNNILNGKIKCFCNVLNMFVCNLINKK